MDIKALRARKEEIEAIAKRYRALNIRVFGSVVRGDFEEGSDIDLLVSFGPGASLLDQAGLMDDLKEALGISVDVVSDRALNHYLRDKILAEAQPL
jgi:predicted nucleotidyltransferase